MISAWSKVRAANRTERIDMINDAKAAEDNHMLNSR
jgi:hypothetical protein